MSAKIGDWYDAYTARIGAVDSHAMFYVKGSGVTTEYSAGVVDTDPIGLTDKRHHQKDNFELGCRWRRRIRHGHALKSEGWVSGSGNRKKHYQLWYRLFRRYYSFPCTV